MGFGCHIFNVFVYIFQEGLQIVSAFLIHHSDGIIAIRLQALLVIG
jgi:hypothetical protein